MKYINIDNKSIESLNRVLESLKCLNKDNSDDISLYVDLYKDLYEKSNIIIREMLDKQKYFLIDNLDGMKICEEVFSLDKEHNSQELSYVSFVSNSAELLLVYNQGQYHAPNIKIKFKPIDFTGPQVSTSINTLSCEQLNKFLAAEKYWKTGRRKDRDSFLRLIAKDEYNPETIKGWRIRKKALKIYNKRYVNEQIDINNNNIALYNQNLEEYNSNLNKYNREVDSYNETIDYYIKIVEGIKRNKYINQLLGSGYNLYLDIPEKKGYYKLKTI